MIRDSRLLICGLLSVAAHVAFARGLNRLPRHLDAAVKRVVSIRVEAVPPPPEPPPEPTPEVVPKEMPRERPRARPTPLAAHEAVPRDAPPPDRPPSDEPTNTPVFGVTMDSTSQVGTGPAMPIGNTARPVPRPTDEAAAGRPLAAPVAAYEVSTMPMPQGRCAGRYTDEAKQAGIEGTVVLDIIVGDNGRVRDVQVVSGLAHGLTQAAVAAVKECRFTPGEKDGAAVPVRIRGFKIRFVLQNDD